MNLTVGNKNKDVRNRSNTDSSIKKQSFFSSINYEDITFNLKRPFFCLTSRQDNTPITPRRSILDLSKVKKIAQQSQSKSKRKRVQSKMIATINLHTKPFMQHSRQLSCKQINNSVKRSINTLEQNYDKTDNVDHSNILKQINLRESNNTFISQKSTFSKKIIRTPVSQNNQPKRCIKITSSQRRQQTQNNEKSQESNTFESNEELIPKLSQY